MFDLWVIIPAAGKSQRFRDVGYETPKALLRIENPRGAILPMMTHVRCSLPNIIDPMRVIVGLPKSYLTEDTTYFMGIEDTVGQADTVLQMIQSLPPEDSVLVLDCDIILPSQDIIKIIELLANYESVIAITESFDPNASRVDQTPFPTRFVEKEPISQWAIVGARAFKNIGKLSNALERTISRFKIIGQEPYLSMAINHYPGTKFAYEVSGYVDLGTPERIKEAGWKIA